LKVFSRNGKPEEIRRFPFLRQHDETDCGAACLGMICKHYGMSVGMGRLRDMAGVSRDGVSLAGLAGAAEGLGFVTRGVRASYGHMMRADLPAVVHWKGNHFIVLFRAAPDCATVADPAVGVRRLSRREFEAGWTGIALLLEHTGRVVEDEPSPPSSSFRRFLPLIRPHAGVLCEILLASLLLNLFGLASPIFTQTIVDRVLVHQDRDLLNLMLIGMGVVAVFQMGTSALRTYLIASVSARLSVTMLSRFYRHLLALPMRFFALRRTGDVTTRFGENAKVQALLTGAAVSAVLDVMMLFVYVGLMVYYHARLAAAALASLPLSAGLTLVYTPILRSISQRAFLAQAEQSSTLIDSLRGVDVVKAMAVERSARWQWERHYVKQVRVGLQGTKMQMLFGALGGLTNLFSSTFILWYGATLVIAGELSVGQLMAFHALIGNVTGPVTGLIGLWPQVQEARIALDRLNDVYEAPVEAARRGGDGVTLGRVEGRVAFEKVFFRYGASDQEPYVLSGVDLSVEPGQRVAIVGRSGAGKTTLVKLIPRLFDPTEGRVTLDGADVRDLRPGWLRRQVGMVLQEPFLFNGTIAENIALGEEEVEVGRMVEAARMANAHAFITGLPMGYETRVGEQGTRLSGGQRQRIAIARALYRDPRVLILDEATNALDTESEQAILEGMEEVLRGRTAFLIAHRTSTVWGADLIVVLDRGRVVEAGGHEDLMERRGMYYRLHGQHLSVA
jgi:ATP-binding cassette subfamily B protein